MQVNPIASTNQVNDYIQLASLLAALKSSTDKLPKTSLPTEIPGTLQEDTQLLPSVTIYTDHGKLAATKPNGNLLGYA